MEIPWSCKLKLNTDGAFQASNLQVACGGVVRDEHGNILWAFEEYLGTGSVLEAELQGIWKSLWYCNQNDWDDLIVVRFFSCNYLDSSTQKKLELEACWDPF